MTCIAALVHENGVVMGADSAGVGGSYDMHPRADPKVFKLTLPMSYKQPTERHMLVGFTSSFRMGQLLRYKLVIPEVDYTDLHRWMCTAYIDAVRQCFKDGGYASKTNEREEAGTFLVAIDRRLFRIDGDYQVGEPATPYDSVGCGQDLAVGALFAMTQPAIAAVTTAQDAVGVALRAAEAGSTGVRGPFATVELP